MTREIKINPSVIVSVNIQKRYGGHQYEPVILDPASICTISRPPADKISHKRFGFCELDLAFTKSNSTLASTSPSQLQLRQINLNFAISTSTSPNQPQLRQINLNFAISTPTLLSPLQLCYLAFNFAKMTPTLQFYWTLYWCSPSHIDSFFFFFSFRFILFYCS